MNLYEQVLAAAQARREARLELRSMRRLARRERFVAGVDRGTWVRQGRAVIWLATAAALSSCALFGTKAPVEYVPYEVKVPIPVPCAAEVPPEPEWATKPLRKADTLDEKAKALLAEREQRMGYEAKLKAATDGCR